jgi:Right handed beta helix region
MRPILLKASIIKSLSQRNSASAGGTTDVDMLALNDLTNAGEVDMQVFAAVALMSSVAGAASLSIDDTANHVIKAAASTSAAGNAVSLDTDSGLSPTLSVNAANPADVKFTVSGLESDYSGTVTFTDSTGKSDIVQISSNGSYSANLANLTNGTLTYVMTVSDPAGNTITVDPSVTLGPSGYADGAANAPAGTPQLPTLLNGYAVRPAWQVAGVDYAVGVPSGTVLKDPTIAANLPAGVSINSSQHLIYVTASNVTINGLDFSLHGGWGIYIPSGITGTVIENSNFAIGSNGANPIQAVSGSGSLTVLNCNFNGGGAAAGGSLADAISYNGSGTFVAEYNNIYNVVQHGIDFGGASITPTVEYNVFENIGMTPGSHSDPWYFYQTGISNGLFAFNTVYQTQAVASVNWGIVLDADTGVTMSNTIAENNTVISTGPNPSMSYNFGVVGGSTLTNNSMQNNYFDAVGSYGVYYPIGGTNTTVTGNINLRTGLAASAAGALRSNVTSVAALPASGIKVPGNTVTITLNLNEAFTVTGTPTLSLNDGGTATYVSGSGTNALTFSYRVAGGQKTSALAITQVNLPNGANIYDAVGNAPNFAGAFVTFSGLQVNGQVLGPTPTSIVESPSTGDLNAGNTVTLTLNLSEAATVAGGTPTLTLNDGGTATYTGGSGSSALTFSYTVGAGQNAASLAATAINLNGA